jgi:hypothetical protein
MSALPQLAALTFAASDGVDARRIAANAAPNIVLVIFCFPVSQQIRQQRRHLAKRLIRRFADAMNTGAVEVFVCRA